MKNKTIAVLFTVSMLIAVPVFASDAVAPVAAVVAVDTPAVDAPAAVAPGMLSSLFSSIVSAPGDLHTKWPVVTGVTWTAVVAIIAYKMGASEAEETRRRSEDLI